MWTSLVKESEKNGEWFVAVVLKMNALGKDFVQD